MAAKDRAVEEFVNTTVRVPRSAHERLRELAAEDHRSLSGEVRRLIFERIAAADDRKAAA